MVQSSRTVPPYRVPPTVLVAVATVWNRREAYWFLVAVIVPAACWSRYPALVPCMFAIVLFGALVFRYRRIASWVSMLRWGVIAHVETVDTALRGDRNLRLAHATGWNVQRRWYTGPLTESTVRYRAEDARGHLFVRDCRSPPVWCSHTRNNRLRRWSSATSPAICNWTARDAGRRRSRKISGCKHWRRSRCTATPWQASRSRSGIADGNRLPRLGNMPLIGGTFPKPGSRLPAGPTATTAIAYPQAMRPRGFGGNRSERRGR